MEETLVEVGMEEIIGGRKWRLLWSRGVKKQERDASCISFVGFSY
jgi:hypothetical protein